MASAGFDERWIEAPLEDLIAHIVISYHGPLPARLSRIAELTRAVFGTALDERLAELGLLLLEHTRREEELVFPWLRRCNPGSAGMLVNLLEREHHEVVHRIDTLRRFAGSVVHRRRGLLELSAQLAVFDAELEIHMGLENRVLFPRALAWASPEP